MNKNKTFMTIYLSGKPDFSVRFSLHKVCNRLMVMVFSDDLADYLIENDPAFKIRVEEAYKDSEKILKKLQ